MFTVKMTDFAKRHTAESPFSFLADMPPCPTHPHGRTASWRTLEAHVEECFDEPTKLNAVVSPGDKDGVFLVKMPGSVVSTDIHFYSGVVKVNVDTQLSVQFKARRPGEEPFLEVYAHNVPKLPADFATIVLYSRELLKNEGIEIDADYGIVSINAGIEHEPMHPVTMMRNFYALPGGTKSYYTTDQIMESIRYWLCGHALSGGQKL